MSEHNHYGQPWSCESIDKRLKSLEAERDSCLRTLATERDRFGKIETELRQALVQIKTILGPLPNPPCCEGAQAEMEAAYEIAEQALAGGAGE